MLLVLKWNFSDCGSLDEEIHSYRNIWLQYTHFDANQRKKACFISDDLQLSHT